MHDGGDAWDVEGDGEPRMMREQGAVDDIWAYRTHIEAALAYAGQTHTFEDILEQVRQGSLQFWPAPASVVITEIIEHPRQRTLHFFLAGGNMQELEAMEAPLVEWGRAHGCTTVSMLARRGWERTFLKKTGWKPSLVLFGKPI